MTSIQAVIHLRNAPSVGATPDQADRAGAIVTSPPDADYRRRVIVTQLGIGLALLLSCGAIVFVAATRRDRSHTRDADDADIRDERRLRTQTYERLREGERFATMARVGSTMGHALGTPLNVISGRAQMIASGLDADEARSSAEAIQSQARKLTDIVERVVQFGRSRKPHLASQSLAELLREAAALLEPLAAATAIATVADDDLEALVDRHKALQLLTALGAHALDRPSSAVTLSAAVEWVDAPADRRCAPGRYLRLSVEDDAGSLDAEPLLDPLFSETHADVTTLGPFVSKGLAREHGGWLDISESSDGGTRFDAWLPQGGTT